MNSTHMIVRLNDAIPPSQAVALVGFMDAAVYHAACFAIAEQIVPTHQQRMLDYPLYFTHLLGM
jgi:hypothetical protein